MVMAKSGSHFLSPTSSINIFKGIIFYITFRLKIKPSMINAFTSILFKYINDNNFWNIKKTLYGRNS